jgi:D-sedoheptulose 7-phosphate isomerase
VADPIPPTIEFIRQAFREHVQVMNDSEDRLPEVLGELIQIAQRTLQARGKILVCGNGGSAADAQHLAAELVCRVSRDRSALPAIALTTDTSALTAISNDYGYSRVFARQVEALAASGDLLIAISTSGNSENVIEAARAARARGCTVAGFTGSTGGRLAEHVDLLLPVPSDTASRIQEVHALCVHSFAQALEDAVADGGMTEPA